MSPQSDTRMSTQLEQMQGQHAKDVLLVAALEHRVSTLKSELATERAAREAAEREAHANSATAAQIARNNDDLRAQLRKAESERDTALARVKELETSLRCYRMAAQTPKLACEHETALASARSIIERWLESDGHYTMVLRIDSRGWLSSHPAAAPVAAPCAGCAELQKRVRELESAGVEMVRHRNEYVCLTYEQMNQRDTQLAIARESGEYSAKIAREESADGTRLRQAIDAAVEELTKPFTHWVESGPRALSVLRAARAKEGT